MDELEKLAKWFKEAGNTVRFTPETRAQNKTIQNITDWLAVVSFEIKKDYPLVSDRLFTLKNKLFMKGNFINAGTFGRISELLIFLQNSYGKQEQSYWECVHPSFRGTVKDKFMQGHYSDATFSASKILMNRLKLIYKEITPDWHDMDGNQLVEHLFSEQKPKIVFSDSSTQTGRNIQRGNSLLFKGWLCRIRNVNAHEEATDISRQEGFQDLLLISKLMSALDNWEAMPRSPMSLDE